MINPLLTYHLNDYHALVHTIPIVSVLKIAFKRTDYYIYPLKNKTSTSQGTNAYNQLFKVLINKLSNINCMFERILILCKWKVQNDEASNNDQIRIFVEEDKILSTLFDEGLDDLHLYKPGSSPLYSERLLTLIPEDYYSKISTWHFILKTNIICRYSSR